MEQKNYTLGVEDIVFMLLETLKSNGTFDEIRRHCITGLDAKPTYQNWKHRIESNVNNFLSKVIYTPELNKNTVRERLRKHLHHVCETQDIEKGADRILTQVLEPRSLSIFEPKIAVAVDEYLGIKNEASPIELNGLKESSLNLIKASNIETSIVLNPKINFISDADIIGCDKILKGDRKDLRSDKIEKCSSHCKEPKSLKGNQSEDENDAGGSSKQKTSQHKISTSDKSKYSSHNHRSSKKDDSYKVVEKFKDAIHKSKNVSKPKDIVDKFKDIVNKPIDIIDKPKDITEKSKDNINKPKDIVDKSKEKLFLLKNSNSNNSSSHKSYQTDTKGTKCFHEKKKKSSNFCKEPKLLNNNRSEDESNSGGSSKLKSTINKIKSFSSDKTKSSSSNHKSSRRDNNSTDIVDKSKDKSLSKNSTSSDSDKCKKRSLSKDSSSSSHKSNHIDTKRLKLSPVEENKLPTNKVCDEERKLEELGESEKYEWNDFQSFIHSNNDIDVVIKDSASTLSNQILQKEIENNSKKVLDDDKSLNTFKGFSEVDAIPCRNYKLLKNAIRTLQVQMNNLDKIDNAFKGFTFAEANPCKHRNNVYAELIKLKDSKSSTGFIGFSEEDTAMSIGHKYLVKQLPKKQNNVDNNDQQGVKYGGNGIQNEKKCNEVMAAYLLKSNNDNDTKSKENYSKPINDTKNDNPTVNNNHNHDSWVVQQEIKYKLLPVKVKLERLMMY